MIRPDATLLDTARDRANASLTVVFCLMLALTQTLADEPAATRVARHGRWLKFGRAVLDFLV